MKTPISPPARAAIALLWAALLAPAMAQPPQTVTLEAREIDLTYPAEAVVEAVRQATVAAQVAGRVIEVRADAGQRVKKGEVLMRIDTREAAEAAAGTQAQLIQAKANYERTKNLHARKFVSGAALDKAEADFKAAQAIAGASGATLSHGTVTAPMAGIVAQRQTELGEMAQPGRPLVTVYDPKGLRVIASIPQYKLAEVRKSGKAKLEFPEAGLWIDAARVEILPTADAKSHTVTARLYLPDTVEGIFPGMAARAHFVAGTGRKLTVPPKAVIRRGEVTGVYVIGADNAPRLRQVRLGETLGNGELEVLAGLAAGDRVSLEPIQAGIQLKQVK
ncbi:MAG: efflux RND transporter periplasmic adaptor subunit [Candidatus Nitricoxidivorans perseverans]|uniref:Efflux RND transporter periplasmic adaptor subunit n=1 Tax=Candidatus Nitricoxidivorans perseverans TaxID=2975601 RepID=A0AA49IYE9_9PROT|nr:MAG: efflux RND transporter periplasmic adaptor subunit [Candidatus Nitricoxidivorans perseverans]